MINSQLNIPVSAGLGVSDSFNKEVSKSFEVGFKGRYLDGRLAINGAIFETEVDDNQFFEFFAVYVEPSDSLINKKSVKVPPTSTPRRYDIKINPF